MALDGMGIVMSRTGILENILAYLVLLGFWALLLDREHSRAKLAKRVAYGEFRSPSGAPGAPRVPADPWGPRVIGRPWLFAAGIFLGLAGGVKWSAIYAVAVFGLAAFAWSLSARRITGVRLWFGAGVFRDGLPAFFAMVPAAAAAYLAAWIPWFADSRSWGHDLAKEAVKRGEGLPLTGAPDAVNSFILYHKDMWHFHHTLSSHHDYQSQMWDWIIQRRHVSFYWLGADKAPNKCGAQSCVEAITSIGNVAVWWLGLVALIVVILAAFRHKDWRAWAILAGYGAMWLPWISYTNRTIFQFYAVAFLPYVVLALTFAVGVAAQIVGRAHSGQPRLSFGFVSSPARPAPTACAPNSAMPSPSASATSPCRRARFRSLPPGLPRPQMRRRRSLRARLHSIFQARLRPTRTRRTIRPCRGCPPPRQRPPRTRRTILQTQPRARRTCLCRPRTRKRPLLMRRRRTSSATRQVGSRRTQARRTRSKPARPLLGMRLGPIRRCPLRRPSSIRRTRMCPPRRKSSGGNRPPSA